MSDIVDEDAIVEEILEDLGPLPLPISAGGEENDYGQPMNVIVAWIKQTEYIKTDRQKAIAKIVKARLISKLKDHLHQEGLIEAINALTDKVSTWVDQLAAEAEKEIKPVIKSIKDFPGSDVPLYQIKRSDKKLMVREMNCYEVAENKYKIDKPMTPADFNKFGNWAEDLINVSEAWTKWVENTFFEAFSMYNRTMDHPGSITNDDFNKWIERKRKEAVDWKRAQKTIYNWAKRWEEWAKYTANETGGNFCGGNLGYRD